MEKLADGLGGGHCKPTSRSTTEEAPDERTGANIFEL